MMRISSIEKLMVAFVVFVCGMLAARIIYSRSIMYIFLLWNIFLAYIPFLVSVLLIKKRRSKLTEAFLFIVWLLFFPNALYILTDLIHLEVKTSIPVWFDAILLFASATTGLIMAFASLHKIELYLGKKLNAIVVNVIITGCLFFGSFGVYLGRFLRWNSWDIINEPFPLLISITKLFVFPRAYTHAWAFTGIFAVFIFLIFSSLKYFMQKANTIDN